jgi:hypothetical protein
MRCVKGLAAVVALVALELLAAACGGGPSRSVPRVPAAPVPAGPGNGNTPHVGGPGPGAPSAVGAGGGSSASGIVGTVLAGLVVAARTPQRRSSPGPDTSPYGRYTYVIYDTVDARAAELTRAILSRVAGGPPAKVPHRYLNIFQFPVKVNALNESHSLSESQSRSMAEAIAGAANPAGVVGAYYDLAAARAWRAEICNSTQALKRDKVVVERLPAMCLSLASRDDQERGPFLVTLVEPINTTAQVRYPYLVIDLSRYNPSAFGYFVDRLMDQIAIADLTDRSRIDTLQTRVLAMRYDASMYLAGVIQLPATLIWNPRR